MAQYNNNMYEYMKQKSENCINLLSDKQDSRTWSMRPVLYVVCSSSVLNEVTKSIFNVSFT